MSCGIETEAFFLIAESNLYFVFVGADADFEVAAFQELYFKVVPIARIKLLLRINRLKRIQRCQTSDSAAVTARLIELQRHILGLVLLIPTKCHVLEAIQVLLRVVWVWLVQHMIEVEVDILIHLGLSGCNMGGNLRCVGLSQVCLHPQILVLADSRVGPATQEALDVLVLVRLDNVGHAARHRLLF